MRHGRCRFIVSVFYITGALVYLIMGALPYASAAAPAAGNNDPVISSGLLIAGLSAVTVVSLAIAGICLVLLHRWKVRTAKNEKRRRQTEKPYRLMVETADVGILILQQMEIKYANRQASELIDIPRNMDREQSRQLPDYVYPGDLDRVLENYEKIIFGKDKTRRFSARICKTDQGVLWLNIRFVPVEWDGGPAILAFIRDITARKMMEKDLQQAQRMEAIGALSGGIAHDFNNILTTIIGNAEVALMDLEDGDPQKSEFEQIQKSGYRARDLVRQILTISREGARDIQPLYLTPLIKEAVKLLQSTLPKRIRIKRCFDGNLNLVKADSMQIYQVFMNLCTIGEETVRGHEAVVGIVAQQEPIGVTVLG